MTALTKDFRKHSGPMALEIITYCGHFTQEFKIPPNLKSIPCLHSFNVTPARSAEQHISWMNGMMENSVAPRMEDYMFLYQGGKVLGLETDKK